MASTRKRTRIAADLFCGGGGFTTGAEQSGRVKVALAVNHWRTAITTHSHNHPDTRHICARIDDIDPRHDRTIPELDILLASPECTHHSIARGGKPIDDQKRATPWHVCVWAEAKRPEDILIENVREFRDWGPLNEHSRPVKNRKGEIFKQWIRSIEAIGYKIDWQLLNAADFGAATSRVRLFIHAVREDVYRKRGRTIAWPEPTHSGRWRPAYEIIDWSKPCPSIFGRKRPLAEKTLRRIEIGLRKFVGEAAEPFIVKLRYDRGGLGQTVSEIGSPIGTITAGGTHHALAVPYLLNYHGGVDPKRDGTERACGVDRPLPVIPTENRYGVVAPFFLPRQGFYDCHRDKPASSIEQPVNTITANHGPGHVVVPYLVPHFGEREGQEPRTHSLCNPTPTVTGQGAGSLVVPFLTKYYGTGGAASIDEPLDTITTKDRFGLAMVSLIRTMKELGVVDIGFRMLDVDELARAQGFPENYYLHGTKAERVRQVGNAVCPPVARALCETIAA